MSTPTTTTAGRPPLVLAGCLVVYAGLAAFTEPLTAAAALAVVGPCLLVLVGAVRHRSRRGRVGSDVRRTAVLWAVLVALAGAWELAAWLRQPAYDVASADDPTLSLLLDPVLEPWPARFAAWCCWLYVGYRLVRR